VRSKVTGNEKLFPAARGPVGKLELEALKRSFPRTKLVIWVIGIFAVHVTLRVFELPIGTDPKSVGELHVMGILTGDP
jgi:hypothetical protein